jgi:hypothetical protein
MAPSEQPGLGEKRIFITGGASGMRETSWP